MTFGLPVDRESQVKAVEDRINKIRMGQTVFTSVLEWYGIPGIGKTTLVQPFIEGLCEKQHIPFACVDFDPTRNGNALKYPQNPILLLEDIVDIIKTPGAARFLDAVKRYRHATTKNLRAERERKVIYEFTEYIRTLLRDDQPVVLAFDTIDKADPDITAWIEEKVLNPIAVMGKCIVIWSGRYPQKWKSFPVRRRVRVNKLEALPPEATKEQIGSDINVYEYTYGHPQSNERVREVIERFQRSKQRLPNDEELIQAVNKIVEERIMDGIPADLKAACRVLAVVRQFDVGMLRKILSEFVPRPFAETNSFLKVIGHLTSTSLFEWDTVRKGYALDRTLRHIMARHLRFYQRERYIAINEMAAGIYQRWIEKTDNPSIYVIEHLYHQADINLVTGVTQEETVEDLRRELQGYLRDYYRDDDRDAVVSFISQLYEDLRVDVELKQMVGDKGFGYLVETVNNHRLELER